MKKLHMGIAVAAFAVSAFSMALAQETTPEPTMGADMVIGATAEATLDASAVSTVSAIALLADVEGNSIGEVVLNERADGKVTANFVITGIPAGWHGFHIHEVGECDATGAEPFSSAGAHYDADGEAHPDHDGDFPNLLVLLDESGEGSLTTDRFTIADLMDADGSAFIVHANPDNHSHIPERYGGPDEETLTAGDSGDRIGCGVIEENMASG